MGRVASVNPRTRRQRRQSRKRRGGRPHINDFVVNDGTIKVTRLTFQGSKATLTLSRAIAPGEELTVEARW